MLQRKIRNEATKYYFPYTCYAIFGLLLFLSIVITLGYCCAERRQRKQQRDREKAGESLMSSQAQFPSGRLSMISSYQQRARVHPMRQEEEEPAGRKFCEVCEENVIPVEARFPDWTSHGIAIALFLVGLPLLCYFPYVFGIGGQKMKKCPGCHSWFETLELNSNNKRSPR